MLQRLPKRLKIQSSHKTHQFPLLFPFREQTNFVFKPDTNCDEIIVLQITEQQIKILKMFFIRKGTTRTLSILWQVNLNAIKFVLIPL